MYNINNMTSSYNYYFFFFLSFVLSFVLSFFLSFFLLSSSSFSSSFFSLLFTPLFDYILIIRTTNDARKCVSLSNNYCRRCTSSSNVFMRFEQLQAQQLLIFELPREILQRTFRNRNERTDESIHNILRSTLGHHASG